MEAPGASSPAEGIDRASSRIDGDRAGVDVGLDGRGVVLGRVGEVVTEVPTVWFAEFTHVISDFVPPATSEVALTTRSVNGVSRNGAGAFGTPVVLLQSALWSTVTVTGLGLLIAYPLGAAVSVTV